MIQLIASLLIGVFVSFGSNTYAHLFESDGPTALVIIDMQPYFAARTGQLWNIEENKNKFKQILEKQVEVIIQAQMKQIPIILIEYTDSGTTHKDIKEALSGYDDVKHFKKNTDGMLNEDNETQGEILKYFKEREIKHLIIMGANGGSCVNESIAGSLSMGFRVSAYSLGIADFNYNPFIYPYDDKYELFSAEYEEFLELDSLEEIIYEIECFASDYPRIEKVKLPVEPFGRTEIKN